MQSCQRVTTNFNRLRCFFPKPNPRTVRLFTTDKTETTETAEKSEESKKNEKDIESKVELTGFAKAFAKFSQPEPAKTEEVRSFTNLLRHSNLVDVSIVEAGFFQSFLPSFHTIS